MSAASITPFLFRTEKLAGVLLAASFLYSCASADKKEPEPEDIEKSASVNSAADEDVNYSNEEGASNPFSGGDYGDDPEANNANSSAEADQNTESNPYAGNDGYNNSSLGLDNTNTQESNYADVSNTPLNQATVNTSVVTEPSNPLANASAQETPAAFTNSATPVNATGPAGPPAPFTASGGVVKYATTPLTATDAPGTGVTIRILEKGDHPLVISEESDYSRLSNGSYVENKGLSGTGVGRDRNSVSWK